MLLQDLTHAELMTAAVQALQEIQDRAMSMDVNEFDDLDFYDPSGQTEYTDAQQKQVNDAIHSMEAEAVWFTTIGDAIVLLDE